MVSNIVLTAYTWATTRLAMLKEERGQDIMEYAVIVGAIALVAGVLLLTNTAGIDIRAAVTEFAEEVEDCINMSDRCGNAP